MKILHVCLSGYFSEGWSYQDNLLVKAHVSMGHKVYILASQYYRDKLNINQTKKTKYKTIEGGIIYRLPYKISRFPLNINTIFRYYSYVKESLGEIHPDFIIVHGGQFLSILSIKNYIKNNKCKAVIDYHSDENNSAKNIFSKLFLHYFLWHFLLKYCNKYFNKIYCVTPSVEKFIIKYYHADEKKIELLPLGADYEEIDKINKYFIRGKIRDYLGISYDSIVFIHGGKIDKNKNTKKLLSLFLLSIVITPIKIVI
jgi:glycosyltransferase involved in cell wall biosynthesis